MSTLAHYFRELMSKILNVQHNRRGVALRRRLKTARAPESHLVQEHHH